MTQLYQRNSARHGLLARQGNGNGNGNGNHSGNSGLDPVPTPLPTTSQATDPLTSPSPVSSASSPPSSSDPVQSNTPSSVQSSSSAVDSLTSSSSSTTPTTSSSTSASSSAPKSDTSSTAVSSSTTSSTSQSTSVLQPTTVANPILNTNQITPTSSLDFGTLTSNNIPVSTTSAPPLSGGPTSNLSAGNIVGVVAGSLIGAAVLFFLVVFLLRRYRRSRRRAMRDSDFGTFRRSMFATPRSSSGGVHTMRNMSETNIAPSLKEPYVPYSGTTAQPPSEALAAATAATAATSATATAATAATTPASGGGLQERPKYVYGQDPSPTSQQQQHDDTVSDAHGGVYSSQPQVQGTYNAEAYGSYAKYEDVGDGIVGSVPTGTAVYQDAQRAYQGQQEYDQNHYANHYATYDPNTHYNYDQSQYRGYGQQPHHPRAYAKGSNNAETGAHVTFGAI